MQMLYLGVLPTKHYVLTINVAAEGGNVFVQVPLKQPAGAARHAVQVCAEQFAHAPNSATTFFLQ